MIKYHPGIDYAAIEILLCTLSLFKSRIDHSVEILIFAVNFSQFGICTDLSI